MYDAINKNVPSHISDLFSNDCGNNPYKSKIRNKEHNVMLGRTPKTEYCKGFSHIEEVCCGTHYQTTLKHPNLKLFLKVNWFG